MSDFNKLSLEDQRLKLKALAPQTVHIYCRFEEDPTIDIYQIVPSLYIDALTPESIKAVLETYIWNEFGGKRFLFNPTKDFIFLHFPILPKEVGEKYSGDYPNSKATNNAPLNTVVKDHLSHLELLMPKFKNITAQKMILDLEYVFNYFPFFVRDAFIVPPVRGMSSLCLDGFRMFTEDENRGSTSYAQWRLMLKYKHGWDLKESIILLQKALTEDEKNVAVFLN